MMKTSTWSFFPYHIDLYKSFVSFVDVASLPISSTSIVSHDKFDHNSISFVFVFVSQQLGYIGIYILAVSLLPINIVFVLTAELLSNQLCRIWYYDSCTRPLNTFFIYFSHIFLFHSVFVFCFLLCSSLFLSTPSIVKRKSRHREF